jgi:hypothetical protein
MVCLLRFFSFDTNQSLQKQALSVLFFSTKTAVFVVPILLSKPLASSRTDVSRVFEIPCWKNCSRTKLIGRFESTEDKLSWFSLTFGPQSCIAKKVNQRFIDAWSVVGIKL